MRKVEVTTYNLAWIEMFKAEREALYKLLSELMVAVHHIGSTSIPNMCAKPIIDLLIEVTDIDEMDRYNDAFAQLGYVACGENGISGRRFFRKGGDQRTHHLHVFAKGHPEVTRHLLFRDYLIAHPDKAQQYSALKTALAAQYPYDIDAYIAGKHAFIQQIDDEAAQWRA